jgi:hypothetical protein
MADLTKNPNADQIKQHVQDALDERESKNAFGVSLIPFHTHNGTDATKVGFSDLNSGALKGNYTSQEYDNGNATGTATINWINGNVQYITLTGNTTLTFTNPFPGMRCILHVAGAFTPTFPSTVRWSAGSTPTATATSGHKDLYSFVYSGKEGLYDGIQSNNFAIT